MDARNPLHSRDYADDVRTLVRYLDRRDDVDEKRIAVAGHGEGGWVGLYAASREKRIDALALLHVPSIRGTELVLEQQRAELDRIQAPAAERVQKIELQRQIHAAVLDEGDWRTFPTTCSYEPTRSGFGVSSNSTRQRSCEGPGNPC